MYAAGRPVSNFARPDDFVPERHLPDTPCEFRNDELKGCKLLFNAPLLIQTGSNYQCTTVLYRPPQLYWQELSLR